MTNTGNGRSNGSGTRKGDRGKTAAEKGTMSYFASECWVTNKKGKLKIYNTSLHAI